MYVDDSGTPSPQDVVDYYVISGVIIRGSDLFHVQKKLEQYRKTHLVGKYSYEEIHVHDIYHSRGNFQALTKLEKYNLLNHLYQIIAIQKAFLDIYFLNLSFVIDIKSNDLCLQIP